MKRALAYLALAYLSFAVIAYLALAAITWEIRNPLGNRMTFWTYMPHPLMFDQMPELQPKK